MSLAQSAPATLSEISTGTPAAPKACDDRLACPAAPDHELAAAVVADVAGARHFHRHVDHRGNHLAAERRRQPLRVVDAVLQRQDGRIALDMGRERLAGGFGVGRFHREEDELGAAYGIRLGARLQLDVLVECVGLQPQARTRARLARAAACRSA